MRVFKLPDLGEGLQEAEVVEWRGETGDEVAVDETLVAVETAKAVVEIPSPYAGRIVRLFANPGDLVHVGAPLIGFEGSGAETDAGAIVGEIAVGAQLVNEMPIKAGGPVSAIKAAPAVRALAAKMNVDLALVTPSGMDGVITAGDVQRVSRLLAELGPAEPLRGVRRAMAQNMMLAQTEIAAATVMDDADV